METKSIDCLPSISCGDCTCNGCIICYITDDPQTAFLEVLVVSSIVAIWGSSYLLRELWKLPNLCGPTDAGAPMWRRYSSINTCNVVPSPWDRKNI